MAADLKVQLTGEEMRAADAEYGRDRTKVRLHKEQCGQRSYPSAVSHVQNEIRALDDGLVKDYSYLVYWLDRINDKMGSDLMWKPVTDVRKVETKGECLFRWLASPSACSKEGGKNSFVTPTSVV